MFQMMTYNDMTTEENQSTYTYEKNRKTTARGNCCSVYNEQLFLAQQ